MRHPTRTLLFMCALISACGAKLAESSQSGDLPEGARTSDAAVLDEPAQSRDDSNVSARSDDGPAAAQPQSNDCAADLPYRPAGCPCQVGQTAACWTGPAADRSRGECHHGVQQCVGNADAEFGTWGPCTGEGQECGQEQVDAGNCGCVPGAVMSCDEDCSVSLFCSLTAAKTCLPDGTWGPCRETNDAGIDTGALFGAILGDGGINGLAISVTALVGDGGVLGAALDGGTIDPRSVIPNDPTGPCRSYFHGCAQPFPQETFTGDCSRQFTCGHAPQ